MNKQTKDITLAAAIFALISVVTGSIGFASVNNGIKTVLWLVALTSFILTIVVIVKVKALLAEQSHLTGLWKALLGIFLTNIILAFLLLILGIALVYLQSAVALATFVVVVRIADVGLGIAELVLLWVIWSKIKDAQPVANA